MESSPSSSIILKILSGLQAGVEVALADGEYRLGSSPDDDIQIIDVTLKPGHVKLRLSSRKIEISGGTGVVTGQSGLSLPVDGDFQEIEPLDVMSAGTTRFALGLSSANWASIGDAVEAKAPGPKSQSTGQDRQTPVFKRGAGWIASRAFAALSALTMVVGLGLVLANTDVGHADRAVPTPADDLATIRSALDSVPFAKDLAARQEVDGAIFVDGYVDTVTERRAVTQLVDKTGIQAHLRLRVLDTMRGEVASLISARAVPVDFDLARNGELKLKGVVLDPKRASDIVSLLGEEVIGVTKVTSEIRTAETLLQSVEDLSKVSKIDPYVLFRLDGTLIEVSGVIPAEKVDSWVGFLQAYAERFAKDVALRSYVQLQDVNGNVQMPDPAAVAHSGPGITIGEVASDGASVPLNVERLKDGSYDLKDVFVGDAGMPASETKPQDQPATEEKVAATEQQQEQPQAETAVASNKLFDQLRDPQDAATAAPAPENASAKATEVATAAATPATEKPANDPIAALEKTPVEGSATTVSDEQAVPIESGNRSIDTAATATDPATNAATPAKTETTSVTATPSDQAAVADVPVVTPKESSQIAATDAKTGTSVVANAASIRTDDELTSLADRLIKLWNSQKAGAPTGSPDAVSDTKVASEDLPGGEGLKPALEQYTALFALARDGKASANQCWPGAALTTDRLAHVLFWLDLLSVDSRLTIASFKDETRLLLLEAALNPTKTQACAQNAFKANPVRSVYMAEIARNPGFIRFIVRDLPPFDMAVTGAMVASDDRYVLTGDGRKLFEGAAPTGASRVVVVGELGIVIQMKTGLATRLYDDTITWIIQ